MTYQSESEFVATPRRTRGQQTEHELRRSLEGRFRPDERARADAQRVDDAPVAIAACFGAEIEGSRAEQHGVLRAEAMDAIVANTDAVGALVVVVEPAEVVAHARDAETVLERIDTERRRLTADVIETWRRCHAAFYAWLDRSGARMRLAPWPLLAFCLLQIVVAVLVETWLCAQLLAGPPIVGLPAPMVLGLLFAGFSLLVGSVAALGHMLAADKRTSRHWGGYTLLGLALAGWAFLSVLGAHMRSSIELGGGGTGSEIIASIHRGLFNPLASPLAILIAAASAATAAVVWIKLVRYFGVPFGHRVKDDERRWSVTELQRAEEAYSAEIKEAVAAAIDILDALEQEAWRPANDAVRLEREVVLIIAQARESERAIDRAHRAQLVKYAGTFRRVQPGIDFTAALHLGPIEQEALGDAEAFHGAVARIGEAAMRVSAAVAEEKVRLRRAELLHLDRVDRSYAETRRSSRPSAGTSSSITR